MLLAEGAGTFMFVTIGAGAIVTNVLTQGAVGLLGIALAHGLALAIAVSVFGAISGGHLNPAVTFALAVARKHPWERVLTYWGAQLAGALLGGIVLLLFFDFADAAAQQSRLGTPGVAAPVSAGTAILIEAVLTLFLAWAFFGTAVSPSAPPIAGFGIGLIVAADILIGGPLTGAAMNPARWFGPAVASRFFDNGLVYWIGPLLGAGLAGLSYRYIFGADEERDPIPTPEPTPPPPTDRTERIG